MEPNLGIGAAQDWRADLEIVRREPAAYDSGLRVGAQPLDQGAVLGSVGDEAGEIIDRALGGDQGSSVVDHRFGDVAATGEGLENIATGAVEGVNTGI